MTNYYIDTCIWINLFSENEDEKYKNATDILLMKLLFNKDTIIISNKLLIELNNHNYAEKVIQMLKLHTVKFSHDNQEIFLQNKYFQITFNLHKADSIHASHCLINDAVLITRDKHFNPLKKIMKIMTPEEFTRLL